MVYVTFIIKKNAVKMMEVSMKKLDRKSITMSMLGLVAIVGVGQQVLAQDIEKTSQEVQAPILVTEVVPNTDNLNSLDAYEYFELTNITDQSVDMENYDLVYLNGEKTSVWTPDFESIPAKSSAIVWIRNEGNTEITKSDFCAYYTEKGYGEIEENSLIGELECDGLSNSGTRQLQILSKTGKILTTVEYNTDESENKKIDVDEAICFSYDNSNVTSKYDCEPTPLTVAPEDIKCGFTFPSKVDAANMIATEVSNLDENTDLNIEVTDTNLGIDQILSGKIIIDGENEYPLHYNEKGKLVGTVPFSDLEDKESFFYQATIFDGTNTAKTQERQVVIHKDAEKPEIDITKVPPLTITEVLPDTSNVEGADAYEFIEVSNNSNQEINLKDYGIYYVYPDTGVQTAWWETNKDKKIQPGEALVFWIKNGSNDYLTRDDFNANFGVELSENELIEVSSGGMANSGKRGIRICTNVGDEIDSIVYNDANTDNTIADKSITYQNQYTNGIFQTVMTSDEAEPTPGTITDKEKATYQAQLTVPADSPKVVDHTGTAFDNSTESFPFSVEAFSNETTIKTVMLYLKNNNQSQFESYKLVRSGENQFEKVLSNVDLLNKKNFTYYFEVSDGYSTIQTEEKEIYNTDAEIMESLNLKDGDIVTDKQQIIANGNQLQIDGVDVSEKSQKSINGNGKIAFEATDTDVFFKNAVAVDGEVVGVFNEGTYSDVATYVYDIHAEKFDVENKTITVEFHAGNKANVLEHNIENNDDFTIRNIRLILPNGKTLFPISYQAKKGLGAVEHDNMDQAPMIDVSIPSQETDISMGDGTSKYEILYATFHLEDTDFDAIRYLWDTTQETDGEHVISNGKSQISVRVDNTAPEIISNIEEGKLYHSGTIEAEVKDTISNQVSMAVLLDGKSISVPYEFRALEMKQGEHIIQITGRDEVGNMAEKEIHFTTPVESATIDENVLPENGTTVQTAPILSIKPTDETNDDMTVTFKKGERYQLGDKNIVKDSGISNQSGIVEKAFEENIGNGFPYDSFQLQLDDTVDENTVISLEWSGNSNNEKTFMYVYNTALEQWEKIEAQQTIIEEGMKLTGDVTLKDHILDGKVNVIVQNGEGYTPTQYDENSGASNYSINETPDNVETFNENDTPRNEYDFTFAVESDTQYYNEDYEDNQDQTVDGAYQHQLNIHNWLLGNRERMNIQYLFHDGDIIDDEPNQKEWVQADEAYQKLDDAEFPYGILAGNHDVGHLNGDYGNYQQYFGESRYENNPWYGESYKDNRGHYDLITVGGIDFIMIYMGWGIGDEEIQWMNDVLAQYPERKAILNFHEYLLASGGLGEEPQRIHDEVVAKNENVCMVLSGHYHNAKTTVDTFVNEDGTQREVYNLLFDYQGLIEGGAGYMRLMHFDLDNEKIIIRTFSPSHGGTEYENYGDYDAKPSENPNVGNEFCIEDANLNDAETFEIPFAELGIQPEIKTLETTSLNVNVYNDDVIGSVTDVKSGTDASYVWETAEEGMNGWYAEVTDDNGGFSRTNVHYINVQYDTEKPILTVPTDTKLKEGDCFDEWEGVSAVDNVDGDITKNIIITGKVNTSIAGEYELIYEVTDFAGNKTSINRSVVVEPKNATHINPEDNTSGNGKPDGGNDDNTTAGLKPQSTVHNSTNVKTKDENEVGILLGIAFLAFVTGGSIFVYTLKKHR